MQTKTTWSGMSDEKLVYVAGPYSEGIWEENIRAVIDAAEEIYRAGHVPFIPHTMTAMWALLYPKPKDVWLKIDLVVLERCDALVRVPGLSEGAEREVEFCKNNDIPVYRLEEFTDGH